MTAIEILDWLNQSDEQTKKKLFGNAGQTLNLLFTYFTPQEIVDRIEKYEADKKSNRKSC